MIKDVSEMKQLPLSENEDVTFYASQHNKTPSSQNFIWRGEANQEIRLAAGGPQFECSQIYCAIYSMSGISIRIAYGFQKDPFGSNAGLMQRCMTSSMAKQTVLMNSKVAQRQKEDEKNAAIEA